MGHHNIFFLLALSFIFHFALQGESPSGKSEEAIPRRENFFDAIFNLPTEDQKPPEKMTLIENLSQNENFSVLVEALEAADLTRLVDESGPFTLFAPTNQAFDRLTPDTFADLLKPENKANLAVILKYHLLPGKKTPDLFKGGNFKTLSGKEVELSAKEGELYINGIQITPPEVTGINGMIYTIDTILVPTS